MITPSSMEPIEAGLLPCPFCSSPAKYTMQKDFVRCSRFECAIHAHAFTIVSWNTRATPFPTAWRDAAVAQIEELKPDGDTCCQSAFDAAIAIIKELGGDNGKIIDDLKPCPFCGETNIADVGDCDSLVEGYVGCTNCSAQARFLAMEHPPTRIRQGEPAHGWGRGVGC